MSIFLPRNASKARIRDAERARRNRAEIVRELSWGRVSRRDLIKWGLFTTAGLLAPIGGLNPLVSSASAIDDSGIPRRPWFGCKPCRQPMPRFDVLPRRPSSVWTFNGCIPPKLVIGRYGEPILFRHHNRLPFDVRDNGGFGRYTISTHEHNGHHGAENDGFTGAFFFPGQFYDYHWPIV